MLYWRASWSSGWQQVHWGRWGPMPASYQSTAQARFHQIVHPQSSSVWSHDYARSACYTDCDFSKYLIGIFFLKQLMLRQSQTCDRWSRTYSKDCFISRSTFSGMTFFFYVASFWSLLSVINFLSHEEEIVSWLQAHGNTSLWVPRWHCDIGYSLPCCISRKQYGVLVKSTLAPHCLVLYPSTNTY